MSFKLPVSVLVVIYAEDTKRVLMLQRRDDPAFWQSVTGSLEAGETALQAAAREVKEEVAIDVACEQLTLIDCQRTVEFEIFSHLRHRYAPGWSAIRNSGSVLRCLMSGRLPSPNIWPTAGSARRKPLR
jgi:dATP pyrophosphohydrolase